MKTNTLRDESLTPDGGVFKSRNEKKAGWQKLAGLLGAVALSVGVCAAEESIPVKLAAPATPSLSVPGDTNAPPIWFPVGEQLRYRIYWGMIPVGEIQSTLSWVEEQGRHLLAATYRARSNRVLRQIYPVEDKMVTIIDPTGFRPVSFRMDMKEGSHIRHEITTFDYVMGKAVWKAIDRQKTKEFAIDPEARDPLSLMYYVRKEGFHSGSNRTLRALADGKVRNLPVAVGGHEKVNVPGRGNVDCLLLTPTLNFESFFVSSGGIAVWISADARCICTRARVSIPVGSITAELIELSGPGTEHWPGDKTEKK